MQQRAMWHCTFWYNSVLVLCYTGLRVQHIAQHCAQAALHRFILLQSLLFYANAHLAQVSAKTYRMELCESCAALSHTYADPAVPWEYQMAQVHVD